MSAIPSNAVQANPYGAPRAAVDDAHEKFQPVRIFAVSGRIGRARYITYTMGLSLLISFIAGMLGALLGPIGAALIAVGWVAIIVISVMLTIQRCHDFDTTGWLALLAVIPLVNLIFWFIPGSDGDNLLQEPGRHPRDVRRPHPRHDAQGRGELRADGRAGDSRDLRRAHRIRGRSPN